MRQETFRVLLTVEVEDDWPLPDPETIRRILAHSTAAEAVATAIGGDAFMKPEPPGSVVCTLEGGVLQDVAGLPDGWTYEVNDLDDLED